MAKNNSKKSTAKRTSRMILCERLDIGGTMKLHTRLKNCAAKNVDVKLNGKMIETIDTTALQLLMAFIRQVHSGGHTVSWQSPSDALLKAATQTGLITDLALTQPAH